MTPDPLRRPYIGHGVTGCLTSATIDRAAAGIVAEHDTHWLTLHLSANAWEHQAARLAYAALLPSAEVGEALDYYDEARLDGYDHAEAMDLVLHIWADAALDDLGDPAVIEL